MCLEEVFSVLGFVLTLIITHCWVQKILVELQAFKNNRERFLSLLVINLGRNNTDKIIVHNAFHRKENEDYIYMYILV